MTRLELQRFLGEKQVFVFILIVAFCVRLPLLQGSFWLDEAAQALESTRPLSEQLMIAADFQPPLYHLVVHVLSAFSQQEWWLRLASLIPGVASIGITMALSRQWFGKTAMMVSGAFLATSSLHVFFSQELRPYMLAVFFAMLSLFLLEKFQGKTFQLSQHWKEVLCLGVVVALGLYSSYVMIFWWPALLLMSYFYNKKTMSAVFFAGLIAGGLFAPWALTGLRDQLAVGAALRETLPGWDAVVSLSSVKAVPLVLAKFVAGVERVDLSPVFAIVLGVPYAALAGLQFRIWQQHLGKKELKNSIWLIGMFVLPLILAWVFSWVTPVIAPKRVLYLLPVLALILGSVVVKHVKLGFIVFMLFMCWNIWSLSRYWSDPHLQRENWRQVVADIEQQFPPDDTAIVMAHDAPFSPWRWYASPSYKVVSTGLAPLQSATQAREALSPILNTQSIVVFDYLRDLSDPYKVIESALGDAGYQEKATFDYPEIGFVRVYLQDRLYAGKML